MDHGLPIFPDFKRIELTDKNAIESLIRQFPPYSDFNFVSALCYAREESCLIALLHGNLVIRLLDYLTLQPFYSFLGNNNTLETIKELLDWSQHEGIQPCVLKLVPEISISADFDQISENFLIHEDPDGFDYILSVSNLLELKFGPNRRKQQTLKQFLRTYPDKVVTQIDLGNTAIQNQIRDIFYLWESQSRKSRDETKIELQALEKIMQLAPNLGLISLGVYINHHLVGFTINEIVHDSFYMGHFGKVNADYKGLGLFIEWETANLMHQKGCTYMNFEQDLGLPGLKSYKQSLHPTGYLKKYTLAPLTKIITN